MPALNRRTFAACVGGALLLWISASVALQAWAGMNRSAPPERSKIATIRALSKGGYVIVMRHASTEFGEVDVYPLRFDDPTGQRSLSDLGRLEARGVGKAMRAAGVPVGQGYASPFRRATETAEYLGVESVVASVDLADEAYTSAEEAARRAAVLRQMVATAPAAGTNVLIVTHKPLITRALGEDMASVVPVEMVVLHPLPGGGIRVVDRLTKQDWRKALLATKGR